MQRVLRHPYLSLALIAFTFYVSFMSIGLDDFDSHSFASAIETPDKALAKVHAPSFPVYLFISYLLQVIVGDTRLALTLLSAASGAVGIVCVAKIGSLASNEKAGFISAGLLMFLPGYWANSEVALSDIPGMTFTLLAVYYLMKAQKKRGSTRDFVTGCLMAGLQLGVRPHNAIPVIIVGVWTVAKMRRFSSNYFRTMALGLIAGTLAVSLWMAPILFTYNGLDGYLGRLTEHRQHVLSADSLFQSEITGDALLARFQAYLDGWIHLLAGGDARAIAPILALLLVGLIRAPVNCRNTQFFILWFIAEAGKIFLFVSLERTRLYLPALVPLILWCGLGYANWRGQWRLLGSGAMLLLTGFFWLALPIVAGLSQIAPPPEQATAYILERYPRHDDTIVVTQGSHRASEYHLKGYKLLYTPTFYAEAWSQYIAAARPQYIVVLDADHIPPAVFDALSPDHNTVKVDDRLFERSARIFPQHASVRLQAFTPETRLKPDQLQLQEPGQIEVGNPHYEKHFGEGWHFAEDIGGVPGRWADQSAFIRVTLGSRDTRMRFESAPYLSDQLVTISANDEFVATLEINAIWGEYEVMIPADVIKSGINKITFEHARAAYPENHHKRLASAYRTISFD